MWGSPPSPHRVADFCCVFFVLFSWMWRIVVLSDWPSDCQIVRLSDCQIVSCQLSVVSCQSQLSVVSHSHSHAQVTRFCDCDLRFESYIRCTCTYCIISYISCRKVWLHVFLGAMLDVSHRLDCGWCCRHRLDLYMTCTLIFDAPRLRGAAGVARRPHRSARSDTVLATRHQIVWRVAPALWAPIA